MSDGTVKETYCTRCEHREVCRFTDELLSAQKAVDDLSVFCGEGRMIGLRDISWIKPVELVCRHRSTQMPNVREVDSIG